MKGPRTKRMLEGDGIWLKCSNQQMFLFRDIYLFFSNVSAFSFCALSLSVFLFKAFCENDAILSSFFGNIIRFHVCVCICMCLNACMGGQVGVF